MQELRPDEEANLHEFLKKIQVACKNDGDVPDYVGAQVGGQWETHANSQIPAELTNYAALHSHNLPTKHIPHNHTGGSNRSVHTHPASSGDTGSGDAIPVTNPYYALYYIMKL